MSDGNLAHDLPVWIPQPLDQGSAMPLRLHFCDDKLMLTVSPGANPLDADAAMAVVQAVRDYVDKHKIIHRVTSQDPGGTRLDTVIIPLPIRG
jgi:hypothetical protein